MFLKTKVKADQIKNLTDARYFAAAGVEWLGFTRSENMSIEDIQSIMDWVDGMKFVLEIIGEISAKDYEAIEILQPDLIQVRIDVQLDKLPDSTSIIRVIQPENYQEEDLFSMMEENLSKVAAYVLDLSSYSWRNLQSNDPIPFATLKKIIQNYPSLLKMNFSPKDINTLLDTLPVEGICLEGSEEEKVGVKDFETLDELMEALTLD